MIGNTIADKIISLGNKPEEQPEEIIISPERRKQIIDDLRCFSYIIKMEYYDIILFLGNIPDQVPRFLTRKWVEIYDESGGTYNVNKEVRFKAHQLRTDLCDYNNAYVAVTGKITVTNPNNDAYDRKLALKNNAPFFSCISKVNGILVENAEDLDVVIPMHNLLEYSKNYRKTTGSFRNYYRNEPNSGYNNNDRDKIHHSIKDSISFNYKTSIIGKLQNNENKIENIKIVLPLKYLGNFWKVLNIPLTNCEVSLDLKWSKSCVLTSKETRNRIAADAANNFPEVPRINNPTNAEFSIIDCKLYIPVVILSSENENKLLEQLKEGFKITIEWNKYRCQISNQTANNNLNYFIDPVFDNVN